MAVALNEDALVVIGTGGVTPGGDGVGEGAISVPHCVS